MDWFSWMAEPTAWTGLATLIVLEIVLGIDNLIFVAILSDKLPPAQRQQARLIGLSLALGMRMILLTVISHLVGLTAPLFNVFSHGVSGRDIIMLVGGAFLLFKATVELHEKLEGGHEEKTRKVNHPKMWQVIVQIIILDAVFSLDAVITAVGMSDHLPVMMLAVLIAMTLMILASNRLMNFVSGHPTVVILCLGFLLMIGFSLIVEGLGYHIPKGYLYAAIGFSVLIEGCNQFANRNKKRFKSMGDMRARTADAILSILGAQTSESAAVPSGQDNAPDGVVDASKVSAFGEQERMMIQRVLQLAEQTVPSIMTPRNDLYWIDLSDDEELMRREILECPYSVLIVADKSHIEEPLGILHKKDIADLLLANPTGHVDFRSMVTQPIFLPESVTVLQALDSFRQSRVHTAFVVDEYGTLEGLVTLTDVIEGIAGDLPEAHEQHTDRFQKNADGSFAVGGMVPVQDLRDMIGPLDLPEGDYHTVAGLVLDVLRRLPKTGDVVAIPGWEIRVEAMEKRRITRVLFIPAAASE